MMLSKRNAFEFNNKTGWQIPGGVGGYLYFRGMTRAKNDAKIEPVLEVDAPTVRRSGLKRS